MWEGTQDTTGTAYREEGCERKGGQGGNKTPSVVMDWMGHREAGKWEIVYLGLGSIGTKNLDLG